MNFLDAVKICFVKYAYFKGCASRPEFWWWFLFTVIASLALQVISTNLSAAFTIATFLPSIAVGLGGCTISTVAGGGSSCISCRSLVGLY
jgi:uncharacterized membrane protein YhaH (DUF805 family)